MIDRETLKRDYEGVREAHPEAGLKPYDELTDDERVKHAKVWHSTHRYFERLGNAIQEGRMPTFEDLTKD